MMRGIHITSFKVPLKVNGAFFEKAKNHIESETKGQRFGYLICDVENKPEVESFISSNFPSPGAVNLRAISSRLENTHMSLVALKQVLHHLQSNNMGFAYLFLDIKRTIHFRTALTLESIPKKEDGSLYSQDYLIKANIDESTLSSILKKGMNLFI